MISLVRNLIIIISVLMIIGAPAYSQVISLSQDRMTQLIETAHKNGLSLTFSNGFFVTDKTGRHPIKDASTWVQSREITHYVYGLLAFRLADKGKVSLDAPLYEVFPDYDLGEFFSVPVTIRHLMAQTAGFSTPPFYAYPSGQQPMSLDLGSYIKSIRPAGQKTHDDIVSTLLLIKALETITGEELSLLIEQELLKPHGLSSIDMRQSTDQNRLYPEIFAPAFELSLTKRALFSLSPYLNRNRGMDPAFLSESSFRDITTIVTYAHHPLDHTRTTLQSQFAVGKHMMRTTALYCHPSIRDQASVFVLNDSRLSVLLERKSNGACLFSSARNIAADIIEKDVPSNLIYSEIRQRRDIFEKMGDPDDPIQGLFMEDNTPSHWLTDRLNRIMHRTLQIDPVAGTKNLLLKREKDPQSMEFIYEGPYLYKSRDGRQLSFSQRMRGGYANLDGETYRFTGPIGSKGLLIDPYYLIILLNLTVLIYLKKAPSPAWRTMAKVVGISTLIFAISIELEKHYGVYFTHYKGLAYLVILWRIFLNIAMMGLFTMPFFAMTFSKQHMIPKGVPMILTSVHLTVLTASSLAIFLWAMTVNISGNFIP
ncbi:serine hydrolase [Temperatibacter marinus]|uniref:Serine hydrolase n=1 Tax=Temperatibacter marinus TaxID=1456591 RepID=A0AA52HAX0_9PROT|nr:serine hydrolase [Temperatibacter marinus]WND03053.1 serine hydrolase [Temperatibacter marinus]